MTPLAPKGTSRWISESFSIDDKKLLVTSWQSSANIPAFIVDISNFESEAWSPNAIPIVLPGTTEKDDEKLKHLSFSKDPSTPHLVYLVTSAFGDFTSVVVFDSLTRAVKHITTPEPNLLAIHPIHWDASSLVVTRDVLYFKANEQGWDVLFAIPLVGPNKQTVFELQLEWEGGGIIFRTNEKNGKPFELALCLKSHRSPGFIATTDLSEIQFATVDSATNVSFQSVKIPIRRHLQAAGTEPTYPTAPPSLIKWKSFDGLEITGMYYRPIGKEDKVVPLIINIHGGPASQAGASYRV